MQGEVLALQLALGPGVGLRATELDDFAPAFEYAQMEAIPPVATATAVKGSGHRR